MTQACFFETEDKVALCRLCPHSCSIPDGKTGLCGARRCVGGVLYAESYGRISALALDPIEKKPLRHFYPERFILSVGSYGCNMSCPFCQNSEISRGVPDTRFIQPEELVGLARKTAGNLGVAFTYNEPFVGMEYLLDTAPLLKEAGQRVVLVTNGMVSAQPLEMLLPFVDAMNIDVKGFLADYYRALGGDLDTVKRTVERCVSSCHVEVTALIVPGENDDDAEMRALSGWLASISEDIPLHITRFFPRYKMTDKPPTSLSTMDALARTARESLTHVYLGNVP